MYNTCSNTGIKLIFFSVWSFFLSVLTISFFNQWLLYCIIPMLYSNSSTVCVSVRLDEESEQRLRVEEQLIAAQDRLKRFDPNLRLILTHCPWLWALLLQTALVGNISYKTQNIKPNHMELFLILGALHMDQLQFLFTYFMPHFSHLNP